MRRACVPSVESSFRHAGGNLSGIGGWLLDRLDRCPPAPGGVLMLYLCYHPDDYGYFNRPSLNEELADNLWDAYERERALDEAFFGPLRFDLEKPPDQHGPPYLRLRAAARGRRPTPTSLEFFWHQTNAQTSPGVLNLLRRWFKPLEPSTKLVASLSIGSGATFAPHLRGWQRDVCWRQPVVYLPEGETELLVGPSPGCDLYAPALAAPLSISYDGSTGEWEWSAPLGATPAARRARYEFDLRHQGRDGIPLALHGRRLPSPHSWDEMEKANRLPFNDLALVGCILPLPGPDGYGSVPPLSPAKLNAISTSALRLPSGDWLYLDARTGRPHLYRPNAPVEEQQLTSGQYVRLSPTPGADTPVDGRWNENTGRLPSLFRGEFRFETPLVHPLVSGPMAGNLPDEIFPQHVDSMLTVGRPPVKLKSTDGLSFVLVVNESARLPVFTLAPGAARALRHEPVPDKEIDLGAPSEFFVGTTHYSLRSTIDRPESLRNSRG